VIITAFRQNIPDITKIMIFLVYTRVSAGGHKALSEINSKDIVNVKGDFAETAAKANRDLSLLLKIFN
jgi:hypothetical protein